MYLKNYDRLKQLIQAYHDEKHSLSPAVKEAREKTDEYITTYGTINHPYEESELRQKIQAERNAVDGKE